MEKLKEHLEEYRLELNWKEISVFKLCLLAFGAMIALWVPEKRKKPVFVISLLTFTGTLILLSGKIKEFFEPLCPFCNCDDDDFDFDFEDEDFEEDEFDDEGEFVMKISLAEEE